MKGRILIVDDDPELVTMLCFMLDKAGYETIGVHSGAEALNRSLSDRPDLIVLDVMMPGMDGYEVCHQLKMKRETNGIPIIMLSAKDTEKDRIVGLETGADAYMFKPFEAPEIVEKINDTIRRLEEARKDEGPLHAIRFAFISHYRFLEEVNSFIGDLFRRTTLNADEIWELKLALHELGVNAIEHGNKLDPMKKVQVHFLLYQERLEIKIEDEGQGFKLEEVPDPTAPHGITRERGRGIYLVSQVVDKIEYSNGGKTALLTKYFKKHSNS